MSVGSQVATRLPSPVPEGEGGSTLERPRSRAEVTRFDVMFAMSAVAGESLVAVAGLTTNVAFPILVLAHFVLIFALGYALYSRRQRKADLSVPLLIVIAASAAGPVGAPLGLAALAWLARPARSTALLQSWYQRLALSTEVDAETQLSDRVASGRVIRATAPAPQALAEIMREGTLAERQAALGLIARFFHFNYLAALSDALGSEEPVIRVQAAAVASKIRPQLAQEVTRRLAMVSDLSASDLAGGTRGDAAPKRLELIRDFRSAVASKLLDKPLERAADDAANRLGQSIDCLQLPYRLGDRVVGAALMHSFEAQLIAAGDFKRLRLLRRGCRLAERGSYKVRAMRPSTRMRAATSLSATSGGSGR